jgi:hypothetical protein
VTGFPHRGGVYDHQGLRRNTFAVVSVDSLNRAGTVVVVEVADDAPDDVRALLAVELGPDDPLPGRWVLCWRINYAAAERFKLPGHGDMSEETLTAVTAAIRNVIEPLPR